MTEQEFDIQVYPLKDKMYRLALHLLANAEDARDAMMETLTRLWQKRESLHEYQSVEALAMSITRNFCLDRLKSKQSAVQRLVPGNDFIHQITPHDQLEVADAMNFLEQVISELPYQQKMVVHLRDVEGYEFQQIAELCGLTENNVKVTLSRARKKVSEELKKIYSYGLK